jgi:hypothetical protein
MSALVPPRFFFAELPKHPDRLQFRATVAALDFSEPLIDDVCACRMIAGSVLIANEPQSALICGLGRFAKRNDLAEFLLVVHAAWLSGFGIGSVSERWRARKAFSASSIK